MPYRSVFLMFCNLICVHRMMTVVEESDKPPVAVCQAGPKINGPHQFDNTSSLLVQAQLVDIYFSEVWSPFVYIQSL